MQEDGDAPGPVGRSLLGLAIGDCLGAAVEGWSADAIRDAHQASSGRVTRFAYVLRASCTPWRAIAGPTSAEPAKDLLSTDQARQAQILPFA